MSDIEIIMVAGVAILGYEATKSAPAPSYPPSPMPTGQTPTAGSTVDQQVSGNDSSGSGVYATSTSAYQNRFLASYGVIATPPPSTLGGPPQGGMGFSPQVTNGGGGTPIPGSTDPEDQAKAQEVLNGCKDWWDHADDDAKKAAIDELNKNLHLNPPLSQNASWKEVTQTLSSGVIEQGGSALGASLGGPAGEYLGALLGTTVGGKVSDFVGQNYDGVKKWISDKLASAYDWAKGEAQSIYDDTIGAIF